MEKSVLNRYVRFIYRKLKREIGAEKVMEEALKIFVLTAKEKARIRKEKDSFFSEGFKDGIIKLCAEWDINQKFINESICVFGDEGALIQVLNDLTPLRIRIRKLTPKECHRLMGNTDEDFGKMKAAGISDSGLYKLAGNSIVVNVLEGIFTQMFREDDDVLF